MKRSIHIVSAAPGDGAAIARLMQQGICAGGIADHRGDPALVSAWLANKHAEQIECWLRDPGVYLNLGFLCERPLAVGVAARSGEVCQCIVEPEHWRNGVGRALVADLEGRLRTWGCTRAVLYSTQAAEGFFQRLGYVGDGACVLFHGLRLRPMQKSL